MARQPRGKTEGLGRHCRETSEVVIDDEIIRYESIGPEGKWNTFLGCQRRAWGTKSLHPTSRKPSAGTTQSTACINGYIIDQETDLLDEVTDQLAHVFNTCGFDMVYFDGCEDVDRRRFDYYAANFQAVAMSKSRSGPSSTRAAASTTTSGTPSPAAPPLISTQAPTSPTSEPAVRSTSGLRARITSTARPNGSSPATTT